MQIYFYLLVKIIYNTLIYKHLQTQKKFFKNSTNRRISKIF